MRPTGSIFKALATGIVIGALLTGAYGHLSGNKGNQQPHAQQAAGRESGNPRQRGQRRYAPAVTMASAAYAPLTKTIEVLGQARALRSIAITSEVTGLVETVNVAPGKRLKQGDILLEIENDTQSIALERARSQYPVAKANAERYRALAAENAGSALEAEQAVNQLQTLEAELRSAEFAVSQRSVAAPFNGIAGITTIEPGDYIRAGDVITTLDDTTSIVVEFAVPQESAAHIELGQQVSARLTSDAERAHYGRVTAIDSRIDSASRTLKVEATIENIQGLLLPGAVFTVTATKDGEQAIALPGLAVQWDRAGAYVWKRNNEGVAARASIVILQRTDNVVLVEGDITAEDIVAADGADRVRAGVPLPARPLSKDRPEGTPSPNSAVR